MATASQKIDSNITGLRYAEEIGLKVLPANPTWYPLEPNSYKDFGGKISTVARNPINPSRQRKKGVTTDLDASGGFTQDLTFDNMTRLLQGFFFADSREKFTTASLLSPAVQIATVTATTFTATTGLLGFKSGQLILASGFDIAANNGLKTCSAASTATTVTVSEALQAQTSGNVSANAKLTACGYQFTSGQAAITMNGNLCRLTVATGLDMTTLGFIPGEWVYLGSDTVGKTFVNNKGFARIGAITTTYIEFDKVSWTPVAEAGGTLTPQLFQGSVIKNESDPTLIKRRTYNVERTLGNDANGQMSEYLLGAVPDNFTLTVSQASKVTCDLSFVAVDNEQHSGSMGLKSGVRPLLQPGTAYNTSTDFSRIKLSMVDNTTSNVAPLFAFATELTLDIKNNVKPAKAIGVLGAFDTTAGTFEVGGKMTVYFADIGSVQAVRNNSDITLDVIMLHGNTALLWDIPLLSLGDGRLAVEQDKPITIPLETNAAESKFNHTLLFQSFPYLPNAASGN